MIYLMTYIIILLLILMGILFYLIPKLQQVHNRTDKARDRLKVRQLYFISGMIGILGLIFMLAMGFYFFSCEIGLCDDYKQDNPAKIIFEACLQSIPPLITLVLGYYFGKKNNGI